MAFDAYRDTHLMLQTRRNINNPTRLLFRSESSLLASEYDRTKPTRILVSFLLRLSDFISNVDYN
jgi:hypothetical protein